MGPDAEESLTHDNECQNVEDEVRGQIMEVQPIVQHETMDEVSFYSYEVSPFLFHQCSYPVILRKILMELQVRHSSFFSSPVDSSQDLSIISPFLVSNTFS